MVSTFNMQNDERWILLESSAELLINRFRLVFIFVFFCIHLCNYYSSYLGLPIRTDITPEFHSAVTLAVSAWFGACVVVGLIIRRGFYFSFLKYYVTVADLLALSFFLTLADGLKSPLAVAYFLIISFSSLRLNMDAVRFATGGSLLSLAYLAWHTSQYRTDLLPSMGSVAMFVAAICLLAAFELFRVKKARAIFLNPGMVGK